MGREPSSLGAAKFAERLGVRNVALSLTHTNETGMAIVTLEDVGPGM